MGAATLATAARLSGRAGGGAASVSCPAALGRGCVEKACAVADGDKFHIPLHGILLLVNLLSNIRIVLYLLS